MLDIAEGRAPVDLTALELKYRKEGNIAIVNDPVARDRLRIDTIKWAAMKLLPRVYGDKVTADADVTQDGQSPEFVEMVRRLNELARQKRMTIEHQPREEEK